MIVLDSPQLKIGIGKRLIHGVNALKALLTDNATIQTDEQVIQTDQYEY